MTHQLVVRFLRKKMYNLLCLYFHCFNFDSCMNSTSINLLCEFLLVIFSSSYSNLVWFSWSESLGLKNYSYLCVESLFVLLVCKTY
jgi:hypothetical protein